MPYFQYPDEFPLSSLPPLIRDAVIEAQQITQAPLGLVAGSAPGAGSPLRWALFHLSARI